MGTNAQYVDHAIPALSRRKRDVGQRADDVPVVQRIEGCPRLPGEPAAWLSRTVAALVVVMGGATREAVHPEPVWRERSNVVIAAFVPDGGDTETEQLWARSIDDRRSEICCIPFFVLDLALADVVETDGDYLVRRVVEPSGRYVFPVWFGESFHPRDEIADKLTQARGVARVVIRELARRRRRRRSARAEGRRLPSRATTARSAAL